MNDSPEKIIDDLVLSLQELVGFHRKLMDLVRHERECLINAEVEKIQEVTFGKEALINCIQTTEKKRVQYCMNLSEIWKIPPQEVTLSEVSIRIQDQDLKKADQIRSVFTVLSVLISRISVQNKSNKVFVENSLTHIRKMKENILGEKEPNLQIYTQKGKKLASQEGSSRILSKEV